MQQSYMKVIILCGSLEPGHCGIGDYSRRLANELARLGHNVGLIALNDKFLEDEEDGLKGTHEGIEIPTLRLPHTLEASERFNRAKSWIGHFDPQWLSFQCELFAFHPKGLPFGLGKSLADLGKSNCWHIMFHELWLGLEKEASNKILLWGLVQKMLIKSILSRLNPRVVHTHVQLYQEVLKTISTKSTILPLISNIAVPEKRKEYPAYCEKNSITFVIFGTMYYGSPIETFAKEFGLLSHKKGIKAKLISIGRNRKTSNRWIAACNEGGIEVELMGEQSPETVSDVLFRSTYGITTTPYVLTAKSGTVIAMLEHGLPVVCIARPYHYGKFDFHKTLPGITEYIPGNLEQCLLNRRRVNLSAHTISAVSHQFVQSLSI